MTTMPSLRQPATSSPNGSESPSHGAAMMKGNLGGIIRDATAGAQADGVRLCALEIIEPELQIELAGIVFDQRELRPAHGPIDP